MSAVVYLQICAPLWWHTWKKSYLHVKKKVSTFSRITRLCHCLRSLICNLPIYKAKYYAIDKDLISTKKAGFNKVIFYQSTNINCTWIDSQIFGAFLWEHRQKNSNFLNHLTFTLQTPTPQNGPTHSNNSLVFPDELFECVRPFCLSVFDHCLNVFDYCFSVFDHFVGLSLKV